MKSSSANRLGSAVPAGAAPRYPARKRTVGLMKKIQAERMRLAVWKELFPIVEHIVEHEFWPRQERFDAHLRKLILLFDRAHADKCMGKRDRAKLDFLICDMAIDLFGSNGDAELLAIYQRHGGRDLGCIDCEGLSLPGYTEEDIADGAPRAAWGDAQAHRPPLLEITLEDRQQVEAERLQRSAGEIYRKLVDALQSGHGDDAAERQRKTALMQRVNAAYAANDLLGLVALQVEVEQIGLANLDKLSEEDILQYNEVLAQHLRQLQRENADWAFAITVEAECPYRERQTPKSLMRKLQSKLAEERAHLAQIERDLEDFQDVQNLKRWLKGYRISQAHQPYVATE